MGREYSASRHNSIRNQGLAKSIKRTSCVFITSPSKGELFTLISFCIKEQLGHILVSVPHSDTVRPKDSHSYFTTEDTEVKSKLIHTEQYSTMISTDIPIIGQIQC